MTIKKLKSIDIINVLSDLVSEKLETTVKLPDYEYTDVGLEITFNKKNFYYNYQTINIKVTLIEKNNRFSIVSLDYNNGANE